MTGETRHSRILPRDLTTTNKNNPRTRFCVRGFICTPYWGNIHSETRLYWIYKIETKGFGTEYRHGCADKLGVTPDDPDRAPQYHLIIIRSGKVDATWWSLYGDYPQSHGIDSSIYYIWRYS